MSLTEYDAAPVTIGSGPDALSLQVSEDAYRGDAQFTVSVDGAQIGGTQTATAPHGGGQTQTFTILGDFGSGQHSVSVDFLNDSYDGTAETDRNLYVTGASINGNSISGAQLTELGNGPQSFTFGVDATQSDAMLLHAVPSSNYLQTASGQAVLLHGDHTWNDGPAVFAQAGGSLDFNTYLAELRTAGDNYLRMWNWPNTAGSGSADPVQAITDLPFQQDSSGKFDLTKFNQSYFDTLLSQVRAARAQGIYVSVMLFNNNYDEVNGWESNIWNGANNVNGVTTDQNANQALSDPTLLGLQAAYVAKTLDTLQGEGNVLYEVANEGSPDSLAWQNTIANYIHSYQSSQGYSQQPVIISSPYPTGLDASAVNAGLYSSSADVISVDGTTYRDSPPDATGQKPAIVDTDHTFGIGGDGNWVWEQVTRGYNVAVMDDLQNSGVANNLNFGEGGTEAPERLALAEVSQAASLVDVATMKPMDGLSSTGYALADPAKGEFIVLAPYGGTVNVDLSGAAGQQLQSYWIDVTGGSLTEGSVVTGGALASLAAPSGDAVLVLTPATAAGSGTTPTSQPSSGGVTIGSGPDALVLQISEDAYGGDAQFTVGVDGTQIGGTQTATASHAAGQSQSLTILGDFGSAQHVASIDFLNDAYFGTPATDRNLYVTGATINGTPIAGAELTELWNGPQSFAFAIGSA